MEYILLALFGLLAGGVVNALADSLPYRQKPALPRYPDGSPRPPIAWLGLFAFVTGRRASAQEPSLKLSWRYPITELATAFLFVLTYVQTATNAQVSIGQLLFYLFHMAVLVLITVIDVEHKLILFVVILPAIALALLDALLFPFLAPNIRDALAGAGLGFAVFFVMYQGGVLFNYVMGSLQGRDLPTAFGYGDVMLITFTGALLGFAHTIIAIFIAVFLGAFGAIFYLLLRFLLRGSYNAFTALPYGPYIVAATVVMLLFGDSIRIALIGY
jgi:prepilin signal peptidase PulO-like enzyme (type II secretory pathway)